MDRELWTTNIRGLVSNFEALKDEVLSSRPSILTVCETFLSSEVPDEAIKIPSYSLLRKDRSTHGGGLVLYYEENLNLLRLTHLEKYDCESIWFRVETGEHDIIGCSAYWPPNAEEDLTLHIQEGLDSLTARWNSIIYVTGDFNAHHTSFPWSHHTNRAGRGLFDLLQENDLSQIVNEPTRITANTRSCLDVVLTNLPQEMIFNCVYPCIGTSDHGVVSVTISNVFLDQSSTLHNPHTDSLSPDLFFNCRSVNWQYLNDHFMATDWYDILGNSNIETMWSTFKETYKAILNRHARKPRRGSTQGGLPEHITRELNRLKLQQRSAWQLHTRLQTQLSYRSYTNARGAYTRARKRLIAEENERNIREMLDSNNLKQWHRYCKSLYRGAIVKDTVPPLHTENRLYSSGKEKACILNKTFAEKASNQAHSNFPSLSPRTHCHLDDVYFDNNAVYEALKRLDSSKACGPDGIQCLVLKKCASSLSLPLSIMFNQSFSEGVLPAEWKLASVVPIYKQKGQRSDPNNYRPISLTSCVGKIMEKIVNHALLTHLMRNKLIADNQFGFLPHHSTTDQLTYLLHEVLCATTSQKCVVACFLDLAAAFDSVPHEAIRQKLPAYGVRGKLFQWLSNFLKDRHQFVVLEGHKSSTKSIFSGVPQGSVIAPTLFLLFMNDLSDTITSPTHLSHPDFRPETMLYADDTMIYRIDAKEADACRAMETDLKRAAEWSQVWRMRFNPQKTKAMFFSRRQPPPPPINFCDVVLPFVEEHRHLGFIIDHHLSFDPHVNSICRKAASEIFLLRRMSHKVRSRDILLRTYKTYIRPHFEYASPAWAALLNRQIDILEKLQRRAIRIIQQMPYSQPVTDIEYASLHLTPLIQRRNFAALCYSYKHLHGLLPRKLNSYMPVRITHQYATRGPLLSIPSVPRPSLRAMDKSPFVFGTKLLNLFPIAILNTSPLSTFKNCAWDYSREHSNILNSKF